MTFLLGMATAAVMVYNVRTAKRIKNTYFTGCDC